MKTIKKVQFWRETEEDGASDTLFASILLLEDLDSYDYPIATWPASLVLAAFITHNPSIFRNKVILELGAGTALPSLFCAHQDIGSSLVYCSERPDEKDLHDIILHEIILNNCCGHCISLPLDWNKCGGEQGLMDMFHGNRIDIILGADIFYCDEDFPSLFRMLNTLFERFPQVVFYTTYQLRSDERAIWPWLERYGLCGEEIQRQQFLSASHRLGICTVQTEKSTSSLEGNKINGKELAAIPVQQFDDISLFCIRKLID